MSDDLEPQDLLVEVVRLREIETKYHLLLGELRDTKDRLDAQYLQTAHLKDALDGLSLDMSLMEDRIRALSGRTEMVPGYPDEEV